MSDVNFNITDKKAPNNWTIVEATNANAITVNTDFGGPGGNTWQTISALSVTFTLPYAQKVQISATVNGQSNDANCNPIVGFKIDSGSVEYGSHGSLGTAAGSATRMPLYFSRWTASLSAGSHTIVIMAAKGTGTSWIIEGTNSGPGGIGTDCRLQIGYWAN